MAIAGHAKNKARPVLLRDLALRPAESRAPKELIAHITDDPSSGGPYVMCKDTDYAHILIPVE
jgi:hypothetical protein